MLRFRDKHVSVFNAEIEEGRQIDSEDILRVKNFVEIALFLT